jgi:exonuclease SbcD
MATKKTTKTVLLTVGDVHLADRTPASRKDDYKAETFNELKMIARLAVKENASAVLFTGDIFHEKSAKMNSHSLVREAISVFSSFPCPAYSIVGNHDISYNRMDTLEKQPLGVLFESGALRRLTREVIGDFEVVGVDFDEHASYETLKPKKTHADGKLVAVCHVYAEPSERDLFGEPVFGYDKMSEGSDVDVYVFGHYHHDQGIVKINDKQFVNIGSLSRGSLNKENVEREVKIGKLSISGDKVVCEELKLPVRPASEIFDIEKKKAIEEKETEIEQFVASLGKANLFESLSSLEDTIRSMKLDSGIKVRVEQYLNNRGAGIHL